MSGTARTIIDKIWDAHVVRAQDGSDRAAAGHPEILAIDFMLIHEVTSAQAFDTLRERALPVFDRGRLLATLDHSIPTRKNRFQIFDDAARRQVEMLRRNCAEFDIPLCDFESGRQGIVHVIGPELGITQPGMTIVCGDSHTSTHGAFGALAFGVGTSEVAHVLATGCILQRRPRTMKVEFRGRLGRGVFAKDAIMRLIAEIGIGGANGHVIEYCGAAVRAMSMEERMTICNMSIECGARAGLMAPDQTTYRYIEGRPFAPRREDWQRALEHWESLQSDAGCRFDREISIELDQLPPMVTWGTNPGQALPIDQTIPNLADVPEGQRANVAKALDYVGLSAGQALRGVPVEWAFIGSCTNGRIEDLRIAAQVLNGRRVHPNVTLYVVPGSEEVLETVRREGLDRIFVEAGADLRMPGCSMCLGMNDDLVPAGKRCISSSNRNFVGRQGPGSITHLASPATVAASAIAGKITSAEEYL